MTGYVTMGSMATKLMSYVNTTMVRDSNYEIAVLMIKNYDRLRGMSITEIADLCYVSQASISRFCRFMGFEGFKEFREYLNADFSIHSDYSKQLSNVLQKDHVTAFTSFKNELIEGISATMTEENFKTIESVAEAIHDADCVAYFSQHFLQYLGQFLQDKLMMMGKYMESYMLYEGQRDSSSRLDNNSLAIVCSLGGTYMFRYDEIWDNISSSGCKIVLLTQNMGSPYINEADYVLQCGTTNKDDIGKYSAMMLIDHIVMSYMKNYDIR